MSRLGFPGNPGTPFQQLLRAARTGDNRARESLYRQFGRDLRYVIASKLKSQKIEWAISPHDIYDAIVMRVWNDDAMYSFGDEDEFLKFAIRAVEREVLDMRRKLTARRRDYRRMESLPEDETQLFSEANNPAQENCRLDEIELLLWQLPEQNQRILEMWLAGKEWDEIAAECGLPKDAARKRFNRSIVRLRRWLTDGLQTRSSGEPASGQMR